MATYQIEINERMALDKSLLAFLHSVPQAVTFIKKERKPKPKRNKRFNLDFLPQSTKK